MPCTDGGVPYPPSPEHVWEAKVAEAGLCAAMRFLQEFDYADSFIQWVDRDRESGLNSGDFKKWWKKHCIKDRIRKGFDV